MRTHDELVQEHESRLGPRLSQEEVAELEDGERVVIVWSGGNGPHKYTIRRTGNAADVYLTTGVLVGTIGPCDMVWRAEEPKR